MADRRNFPATLVVAGAATAVMLAAFVRNISWGAAKASAVNGGGVSGNPLSGGGEGDNVNGGPAGSGQMGNGGGSANDLNCSDIGSESDGRHQRHQRRHSATLSEIEDAKLTAEREEERQKRREVENASQEALELHRFYTSFSSIYYQRLSSIKVQPINLLRGLLKKGGGGGGKDSNNRNNNTNNSTSSSTSAAAGGVVGAFFGVGRSNRVSRTTSSADLDGSATGGGDPSNNTTDATSSAAAAANESADFMWYDKYLGLKIPFISRHLKLVHEERHNSSIMLRFIVSRESALAIGGGAAAHDAPFSLVPSYMPPVNFASNGETAPPPHAASANDTTSGGHSIFPNISLSRLPSLFGPSAATTVPAPVASTSGQSSRAVTPSRHYNNHHNNDNGYNSGGSEYGGGGANTSQQRRSFSGSGGGGESESGGSNAKSASMTPVMPSLQHNSSSNDHDFAKGPHHHHHRNNSCSSSGNHFVYDPSIPLYSSAVTVEVTISIPAMVGGPLNRPSSDSKRDHSSTISSYAEVVGEGEDLLVGGLLVSPAAGAAVPIPAIPHLDYCYVAEKLCCAETATVSSFSNNQQQHGGGGGSSCAGSYGNAPLVPHSNNNINTTTTLSSSRHQLSDDCNSAHSGGGSLRMLPNTVTRLDRGDYGNTANNANNSSNAHEWGNESAGGFSGVYGSGGGGGAASAHNYNSYANQAAAATAAEDATFKQIRYVSALFRNGNGVEVMVTMDVPAPRATTALPHWFVKLASGIDFTAGGRFANVCVAIPKVMVTTTVTTTTTVTPVVVAIPAAATITVDAPSAVGAGGSLAPFVPSQDSTLNTNSYYSGPSHTTQTNTTNTHSLNSEVIAALSAHQQHQLTHHDAAEAHHHAATASVASLPTPTAAAAAAATGAIRSAAMAAAGRGGSNGTTSNSTTPLHTAADTLSSTAGAATILALSPTLTHADSGGSHATAAAAAAVAVLTNSQQQQQQQQSVVPPPPPTASAAAAQFVTTIATTHDYAVEAVMVKVAPSAAATASPTAASSASNKNKGIGGLLSSANSAPSPADQKQQQQQQQQDTFGYLPESDDPASIPLSLDPSASYLFCTEPKYGISFNVPIGFERVAEAKTFKLNNGGGGGGTAAGAGAGSSGGLLSSSAARRGIDSSRKESSSKRKSRTAAGGGSVISGTTYQNSLITTAANNKHHHHTTATATNGGTATVLSAARPLTATAASVVNNGTGGGTLSLVPPEALADEEWCSPENAASYFFFEGISQLGGPTESEGVSRGGGGLLHPSAATPESYGAHHQNANGKNSSGGSTKTLLAVGGRFTTMAIPLEPASAAASGFPATPAPPKETRVVGVPQNNLTVADDGTEDEMPPADGAGAKSAAAALALDKSLAVACNGRKPFDVLEQPIGGGLLIVGGGTVTTAAAGTSQVGPSATAGPSPSASAPHAPASGGVRHSNSIPFLTMRCEFTSVVPNPSAAPYQSPKPTTTSPSSASAPNIQGQASSSSSSKEPPMRPSELLSKFITDIGMKKDMLSSSANNNGATLTSDGKQKGGAASATTGGKNSPSSPTPVTEVEGGATSPPPLAPTITSTTSTHRYAAPDFTGTIVEHNRIMLQARYERYPQSRGFGWDEIIPKVLKKTSARFRLYEDVIPFAYDAKQQQQMRSAQNPNASSSNDNTNNAAVPSVSNENSEQIVMRQFTPTPNYPKPHGAPRHNILHRHTYNNTSSSHPHDQQGVVNGGAKNGGAPSTPPIPSLLTPDEQISADQAHNAATADEISMRTNAALRSLPGAACYSPDSHHHHHHHHVVPPSGSLPPHSVGAANGGGPSDAHHHQMLLLGGGGAEQQNCVSGYFGAIEVILKPPKKLARSNTQKKGSGGDNNAVTPSQQASNNVPAAEDAAAGGYGTSSRDSSNPHFYSIGVAGERTVGTIGDGLSGLTSANSSTLRLQQQQQGGAGGRPGHLSPQLTSRTAHPSGQQSLSRNTTALQSASRQNAPSPSAAFVGKEEEEDNLGTLTTDGCIRGLLCVYIVAVGGEYVSVSFLAKRTNSFRMRNLLELTSFVMSTAAKGNHYGQDTSVHYAQLRHGCPHPYALAIPAGVRVVEPRLGDPISILGFLPEFFGRVVAPRLPPHFTPMPMAHMTIRSMPCHPAVASTSSNNNGNGGGGGASERERRAATEVFRRECIAFIHNLGETFSTVEDEQSLQQLHAIHTFVAQQQHNNYPTTIGSSSMYGGGGGVGGGAYGISSRQLSSEVFDHTFSGDQQQQQMMASSTSVSVGGGGGRKSIAVHENHNGTPGGGHITIVECGALPTRQRARSMGTSGPAGAIVGLYFIHTTTANNTTAAADGGYMYGGGGDASVVDPSQFVSTQTVTAGFEGDDYLQQHHYANGFSPEGSPEANHHPQQQQRNYPHNSGSLFPAGPPSAAPSNAYTNYNGGQQRSSAVGSGGGRPCLSELDTLPLSLIHEHQRHARGSGGNTANDGGGAASSAAGLNATFSNGSFATTTTASASHRQNSSSSKTLVEVALASTTACQFNPFEAYAVPVNCFERMGSGDGGEGISAALPVSVIAQHPLYVAYTHQLLNIPFPPTASSILSDGVLARGGAATSLPVPILGVGAGSGDVSRQNTATTSPSGGVDAAVSATQQPPPVDSPPAAVAVSSASPSPSLTRTISVVLCVEGCAYLLQASSDSKRNFSQLKKYVLESAQSLLI